MIHPDPATNAGVWFVLGMLVCFALCTATDFPEKRNMATVTIPDPIATAFTDAMNAKADADAKASTDAANASALAAAQAAKSQSAADVAAATQTLAAKRAALDAVVDSYFQAANPPEPAPAPAAVAPAPVGS